MTETILGNLGVWAVICIACLGLVIIQSLLIVGIGMLGGRIYKKLTRLYALHVVWYWLERLEKEGTHCFERAATVPPLATEQEEKR